ncbi:2-amino-3-carboxymuconate 6-semialdehyde decarboxylase [Pediococcus damnosus]|uniref:6-methylsalicylate decarboxylase n=1 Tax=Pediococcus damnosus TaxID=51663 RepID=A0A0R2HMJ9_9LACO|nr:amidohydrolase family protein [Pediococcus damnosus]AMV60395.1 2-amino-3-carboxymuconate 6-semialdehyde decarboxylase [Pediococcus damnosus]AMV63204.1 2-amino-3-carboxymuconate 6-semialdehyde decarboxylase [Pediococcus damnosus]AMV64645.1 2-amino-3-carboxymuconate 6-semialdehyde decarboxylase [Pediococcus damnosus]AMV66901.1 2-amino-3-carboxymuconate 6-semialdehyde decarboxylase [Pediococcus damnosus]AMV69494.1 2-amino-3-carboxymuconate 6-semialdehyde decarboxylase [Pediococcus damnosus]
MYKKIDFHAHYLSPGFKSFLKTYFDDHGDGVKTPDYTIDSTLKTMADNNVEYSIISLSSPHISNTNDAGKTSDLATEANEYGAKQQQTYPDKIGFAASLPLPYVDESIAEIDRARANHASAFTLPTNANGTYLGDPSLDPIMEKLNEQKTLVMLHPNEPKPIAKDVNSELPAPIMEFFFDTTRAVTNMVLHSVFTRYTNIKFIIPHAGALLPVISDRLSLAQKLNPDLKDDQVDMGSVLATQYFDVAGMVLPHQLPVLQQVSDPTHLLYATDAPYTPAPQVIQLTKELENTGVLSEATKQMIFYKNGKQLLDELK